MFNKTRVSILVFLTVLCISFVFSLSFDVYKKLTMTPANIDSLDTIEVKGEHN